MRTIDIATLDASLLADLDAPHGEFEAFEADCEDASYSNQCWHIVYHRESRRGGIVFVGSGSDGRTAWTDAGGPEDVLNRYLNDEMMA